MLKNEESSVIPFSIERVDFSDVEVNLDQTDIIKMFVLIKERAREEMEGYNEIYKELMKHGPILKSKIGKHNKEYFHLRQDKLYHVVEVLFCYGFIRFNEEKGVIEQGDIR